MSHDITQFLSLSCSCSWAIAQFLKYINSYGVLLFSFQMSMIYLNSIFHKDND
jgi:hypothetical protein